MSNKIQLRPEDSTDEKTIEENLKKMNYDPKEDIMRQGEEVNADLETTDKQAASARQLAERENS